VILFYLLVSVMPLMRHPFWSMFASDLTMVKYLGLGCALYALGYATERPTRPRFFRTSQARWFVSLALWAMLSYLTIGARGPFEQSHFLSYLSFLLLLFVTLVVVDSPRRLRFVLLAAIASVAFASLYVIREWQKYDILRPGWVVGDPNYYSISAVLCLPIAWCLAQERRVGWQRSFCLGSLGIVMVGFSLAASRGALLGLLTSLSYLTLRTNRRARAFCFLAALSIPLMVVSRASPIKRLLAPTASDVQAVEIRESLWGSGLQMVRQHPLTGVGLGNFKPMVRQYSDSDSQVAGIAHNTYIEVAAELGIPALVAFLAVLLCSLRSLETTRRRAKLSGRAFHFRVALGLQAALVGYAVNAFFISAQYQKLFWLVVFLTVCLHELSRVAISNPTISAPRRASGSPRPRFAYWSGPRGVLPQPAPQTPGA
jgi:putative inorganic carbon (hco3(-)) transporter